MKLSAVRHSCEEYADCQIQISLDANRTPPPLLDIPRVAHSPRISPCEQFATLLSLKKSARKAFAQQIAATAAEESVDAAALEQNTAAAYQVAKRLLDIFVAAAALVIFFPVFAVIAVMIVASDGGSVLYHQPRMGRDGRSFRFYKFRSMVRDADAIKAALHEHNEAEGPIFKMRNDPRVTRVGRVLRKYSLDELPQLISVVRGDMSLIGPRPMIVSEAMMCDSRQWQRHRVRPGLLCLREICGRSGLSFSEWVEMDLLYVACQSFHTDIRILFSSIPEILHSDHAY